MKRRKQLVAVGGSSGGEAERHHPEKWQRTLSEGCFPSSISPETPERELLFSRLWRRRRRPSFGLFALSILIADESAQAQRAEGG